MCKKIMIAVALLALMAPTAFAGTGPGGVFNTPHNLSSLQIGTIDPYVDGSETEVCIFCHTPHGGSLDAPLWNRDLTSLKAATWAHYDSAFLTSLGISSSRAVQTESLTCLSCHDGSIAVGDSLIKTGNVSTLDTTFVVTGASFDPKTRIGTSRAKLQAADSTTYDLRDDHPISVSYNTIMGSSKASEFWDVATVEGKGLTLFGTGENVECSTCHDPHVDYVYADTSYDPFLAIPNAGSALCLSCHKK